MTKNTITIHSKLKTQIHEMVKAEVRRKITEARFESVWDVLEGKDETKEFGDWIKRRFGKNVPEDIEGKDVVDFMDKNPGEFNLSPAQFVHMFKAKESVGKAFASKKADAEIDDVEASLDGDKIKTKKDDHDDEHVKSGDVPLHIIAKELGVTTEAARLIVDKAQVQMKIRADFAESDPEGFSEIILDTLDKYVLLLQKVGQMDKEGGDEGDSAAAILNDLFVAEKIMPHDLEEYELVILQHLSELAADGETGHVESLLLQDLGKYNNVIKSFQEMVARSMKKRDQGLGLIKKRGRPTKVQTT